MTPGQEPRGGDSHRVGMGNPMRLPGKDPRLDEITFDIMGAAIEVHRHLGSGCLERPYSMCLAHELALRGRRVDREVAVDLSFKGLAVPGAFRMDLVVDERIPVEVKAIEEVHPVHLAQLATCLRLARKDVGVLINFREKFVRDGYYRVAA